MNPLQSWLLMGSCLSLAAAIALALGRLLMGEFSEDGRGPDAPPAPRPLAPSPVTSFDQLEFERAVLATIDQLPEVAA